MDQFFKRIWDASSRTWESALQAKRLVILIYIEEERIISSLSCNR